MGSQQNEIILGVFGKRDKADITCMFDEILTPILQELRCIPQQILLPTEGKTSLIIQEWAESLSIKYMPIVADWMRNGKMASIMRDKYILQECTYALVIDGLKTDRYKQLARQILRKGKSVFLVSGQFASHQTIQKNQQQPITIEYLIPEIEEFSKPKPSVKNPHEMKCLVQISEAKEHDHTSDSKKGPLLRLWQSSIKN